MSRIRAKINRGDRLTPNELASLENLPDQEVAIYIRVSGKCMDRSVLSVLKKIQSVRKTAKNEAEKQRLEQIKLDNEEASKQRILISKSLPTRLKEGYPLTEMELGYLETLEISDIREILTRNKAEMHPNALRKIKEIISRVEPPEIGKREQKSFTSNGWSRLEGRPYKK